MNIDANNLRTDSRIGESKEYKLGESKEYKLGESKLKCMYMNARSIVNKRKEVELTIRDENLDLLAITETWLNDKISDEEFNISGYMLFRKDRKESNKLRGGGVAMYIRNELNPTYKSDLNECAFSESLWCNIKCGMETTLLGVCYRAPDSLDSNDEKLFSLLNEVSRNRVVVMGDFNFAELNWNRLENLDSSHPFVDCLNNNFLYQVIDEPTRGKNYLDLILSSEENMAQNVIIGEPFETSDHQIARFELISQRLESKKITPSYDYFKVDYNIVRKQVTSLQGSFNENGTPVSERWLAIKYNVLSVRDKYVGYRKKSKNKSKWATNKVRKCRNAKKKAWSNYIRSKKDERRYQIYKTKLRDSVKENRKAKQAFEEKLANNIKSDSKSFFAYVNSNKRSNNKIGPLKNSEGKVVEENREASNLLNNYFASVFTKEDVSVVPEPEVVFKGTEYQCLAEIEINKDIVLEKLNSINVNKCQGPDEIHGKIIYEIRHEIAEPLTKLFKLSLETSTVPQDWRDANVCPLFKKGSRAKAENYRPVSLTSVVGKICESIIKDRIVKHLEENKLLRNSQHGFTSGRSCLTNLLEFFETVTKELDEDNNVDIVYLDFCKAFDKVPHCRLIKKLESHGIKGKIRDWIKSWLSNRRQRVCVDGELSDWVDVTSGVPQGSVLGPVLFLIYINDIDQGIVSKLGKFADDSKLCKNIRRQDVSVLVNDLAQLESWSNLWQMKFNVEKCSVIHLGKSNVQNQYLIESTILKSSDKERDLGVIVDYTMKFSEQVNGAVCKANATLGMIKRNITCKNKNIVSKLYKALVRPKLEYCVQLWRPYLKKDIDKIEGVQHRATKMIKECAGLTYENRLKVAGLTTLEERRIRGDMIEVFKILKGINKCDRDNWFQLANNNRTRGHRFKLIKNRSRLDIRKHFFSQRVVNDWNNLPEEVVDAETVNSFKNRYDKHIRRNKNKCF